MLRVTSVLMLLALLACVLVFAQAPTGIITGVLTDESGAVIPNATITIVNTATGEIRTASSNGAGLYDFSNLQHGTYNLDDLQSGTMWIYQPISLS